MSDVKDSNDQEKKKDEGGEGKDSHEDLDDILGQIKESDDDTPGKPEKQQSKEIDDELERMHPKHEEGESGESEPESADEILERISEKEPEVPVEDMNVGQRVIGIFTGPTKVFQYLRAKPDIWTPIIIAVIISLLTSFFVYDIAINDQIVRYEENDNLPDEQKERIIDELEASREGPRKLIYTAVFPVLAVLIIFVLVSAIFLFIGNVLLGGKAKFKQVLSAYGYSYLILALLATIVKLPLWLSKQTMKIDLSPAVFMAQSASESALYNFVSSLDLFNIWFVLVFGLGLSVIYGFSKLKGLLSVIIAWLLYIAIFKVALGNFLSGFTG
jgi:hypothetical protein